MPLLSGKETGRELARKPPLIPPLFARIYGRFAPAPREAAGQGNRGAGAARPEPAANRKQPQAVGTAGPVSLRASCSPAAPGRRARDHAELGSVCGGLCGGQQTRLIIPARRPRRPFQ